METPKTTTKTVQNVLQPITALIRGIIGHRNAESIHKRQPNRHSPRAHVKWPHKREPELYFAPHDRK